MNVIATYETLLSAGLTKAEAQKAAEALNGQAPASSPAPSTTETLQGRKPSVKKATAKKAATKNAPAKRGAQPKADSIKALVLASVGSKPLSVTDILAKVQETRKDAERASVAVECSKLAKSGLVENVFGQGYKTAKKASASKAAPDAAPKA